MLLNKKQPANLYLCVGGADSTLKLHSEQRLLPMISGEINNADIYDYDLVVIGGGSGGLAAAKVRVYNCFSC